MSVQLRLATPIGVKAPGKPNPAESDALRGPSGSGVKKGTPHVKSDERVEQLRNRYMEKKGAYTSKDYNVRTSAEADVRNILRTINQDRARHLRTKKEHLEEGAEIQPDENDADDERRDKRKRKDHLTNLANMAQKRHDAYNDLLQEINEDTKTHELYDQLRTLDRWTN